MRGKELLPDWDTLGGSFWRILANAAAVVPVFTTAFSVQATAPFVVRSSARYTSAVPSLRSHPWSSQSIVEMEKRSGSWS